MPSLAMISWTRAKPVISFEVVEGNRVGAVIGGRSSEPVNSLFDGKGFIWKLEELCAAAVFKYKRFSMKTVKFWVQEK